MRTILQTTTTRTKTFVVAALLLLSVGLLIIAGRVNADDGLPAGARLVTLHDRGETQVFPTEARTIGDALKSASIHLDKNDVVEPSVDAELLAHDYQVNIYRARPVTIIDGARRQQVLTPYQTPAQIADVAEISLREEDVTKLTRAEDILSDGPGLELRITRATPFAFTLYGKTFTAYTQAKTVKDMLADKKITIGEHDRVSVPVETALTEGLEVRVWREGKQTISVDEAVAFETETIKDADRPIGFKEVRTAGVDGQRTATYEITIQDGQETARVEIASVTLKEAKKQVEVVGTKVTNTFTGSFAEALARLRSCEGSYSSNTGNGYYGAYQFDIQTWGGYKGYPHAAAAPAAVQDEKAWETYQRRGWQPWPSCKNSKGLQDIYR